MINRCIILSQSRSSHTNVHDNKKELVSWAFMERFLQQVHHCIIKCVLHIRLCHTRPACFYFSSYTQAVKIHICVIYMLVCDLQQLTQAQHIRTMRKDCTTPAVPTIQVRRRKRITPKIFCRHGRYTPISVPMFGD